MRRDALRNALCAFTFLGLAGLAACETAELTTPQPCRGELCTCEQDPYQLRCRGFSPDDASLTDGPGEPLPDVVIVDSGTDDADASGSTDADADAPD